MPRSFQRLNELASAYPHVFLSPHLDDAVLSCGGAIARFVARHEPVLVVTLCAGQPPVGAPLSPFAQQVHALWRLDPDQVMQQRLLEDQAALARLGADALRLGFLDAIYRCPAAYVDNETLFGTVAASDDLALALDDVLRSLWQVCPQATFYAPLAVGHHVDHQIVRQVALRWSGEGMSMLFYEDVPYVLVPGALEPRLSPPDAHGVFVPRTIGVDATLTDKIYAVEAYASQIESLFGTTAAMAQALTAYARQVAPDMNGYGERVWQWNAGPETATPGR